MQVIISILIFLYSLPLLPSITSNESLGNPLNRLQNKTQINLRGVVKSSEGKKLEGIKIIVQGDSNEIYETSTDEEGLFCFLKIDVDIDKKIILKLEGEKGTGKIAFSGGELNKFLELEYPVLTTVVILHDNDQHFNFNFQALIKEQIETIRKQYSNVFHLNAGDIFVKHSDRWLQPYNYLWYRSRALYIISVMNNLGYDALTVGNHELQPQKEHTLEALKMAKFPLLASNIETNTKLLPEFKPYVVFNTKEEYTLAVLGLTTTNYDGVNVLDPIITTIKYRFLRENNIFIALTHLGIEEDKKLAHSIPELDAILGAHSHTLLCKPLFINNTILAQAGGGGHYLNPNRPMYLGMVKITLENGHSILKEGTVLKFTEKGVKVARCETNKFQRQIIYLISLFLFILIFIGTWLVVLKKRHKINS